jgi:hypothetical protein
MKVFIIGFNDLSKTKKPRTWPIEF